MVTKKSCRAFLGRQTDSAAHHLPCNALSNQPDLQDEILDTPQAMFLGSSPPPKLHLVALHPGQKLIPALP